MLATTIFGLWVRTLVVYTRSLWPAILIHAISNSFVLVKALSSQWFTPYYLSYLRASLFELPLVVLGLYVALKLKSNAKQDPDEASG